MIAEGIDCRRLSALLVIIIGLGVVVGTGVLLSDLSEPTYRYTLTTYGTDAGETVLDGIYQTDELSAPAQAVVAAARDDPATIDTDDLAAAPEFESADGVYLLHNEGGSRCLSLQGTEPRGRSFGPCGGRIRSEQVVYEFATLSDRAQTVVRNGLNASEGRFVRAGHPPSSFEGRTDVLALGGGVYVVETADAYHELTVRDVSVANRSALWYLTLVALLCGIGLAVAGVLIHQRRRTGFALALLLGCATVGLPIVVSLSGRFPVGTLATHFGGILLAGGFVFSYAWLVLSSDGGESPPASDGA